CRFETMKMSRFLSRAGISASALAGVLAALPGPSAWAAAADDNLAAIRNEIMKLKEDYETKIKDLEDRLIKAETEAEAARDAAAAAQATATAAQESARTAEAVPPPPPPPAPVPTTPPSQNVFNPNVSAVLNGFFTAANHDPSNVRIPGFALGDEAQG